MNHKGHSIILLAGNILLYTALLFTPLEIMPCCSAAGLDFAIIPAEFNAPLEFLTGFTLNLPRVYAATEDLLLNNLWTSSQQYSPDSYENDNRHGYKSAQIIVIDDSEPQHHNFHKAGDVDWVKFYGLANTSYRIEVVNPGSKCDAVIELYDTDGTTLLLKKDDYLAGMPETLDYTFSKEGIYYVKVSNYTFDVSGAGTEYDLKVWKPTAPSFIGILTGIVSDSITKTPIRNARVKTDRMGSSLSSAKGSYVLVEEQGNHLLTVDAYGYQPFSQNVSITPGKKTFNVEMTPIGLSEIKDSPTTPLSPSVSLAEEKFSMATSYGSALNGITYFTNIFVAAGDYGALTTSPDGKSWTDRSFSTDNELYAIIYGNNIYASVGDYGTVLSSADSTLWTKAISNTQNHLYGVSYGKGLFVAVGYGGKILSSTDGNIWTDRSFSTSSALYGITYGNGLFVAVGDRGKILSSSDGNIWTDRGFNTNNALFGVTYGNGIFVGVGEYGTILTSSDGTVWTNRSVNPFYELYTIAYGNGTFIAAGDGGRLLSSHDVVTWTATTSYTDKGLYGIAHGNGAFVAVGDHEIILISLSNRCDFNGDGKTDILWRNKSTGQSVVWLMNGTTYSSYTELMQVTDTNWEIVGTGDFNGDGKTDILWRNKTTGQNVVWYMNGTAYSSYVELMQVTDTSWEIVGTGDFNNDSKTDILWRNKITGQNIVWLMNGTAYNSYAELMWVADTNWEIVGMGDFNGDGKTDILWRNKSTGQNIVWYMNGANYSNYVELMQVTDTNWEIVGTGDFNGDGKTDILWRNKSTGQNVVWFMDGATYSTYAELLQVPDTNWEIVGPK